jgi:nucleotide-binding universal stress UspA family protein
MNAFWASENFEAFIVFRSSQPRDSAAQNSSQNWSSFPGSDQSDVAKKGVEHGIALAKALNAKVTVITVTEMFPVEYGSGGWIPTQEMIDSFNAGRKEFADKVLNEAQAMAEQIGISAELVHVPNAFPAIAIIDTAKSRGCDLIVMGSHGRRSNLRRRNESTWTNGWRT